MSLEQLISSYGYAAVGIGTFLEGESILVLGGFAAHRGYLALPWVIASAFIGTLFGDQLYYYIGRIKGKNILENRPRWKSKSKRVLELLENHQTLLILGFRFLYGLRTVTPFVIGLSNVAPLRYLLLNILGALIWATVIGGAGYLFGNTLELILGDIKKYERVVFLLIIGAAACLWLYYYMRNSPPKSQ